MTGHFQKAISHVVTVMSLGVIITVTIILLAQIRKLGENIKAQTDINQRYLRCILLIERKDYEKVETRVAAIDKCAIQSKLPSGKAAPKPAGGVVEESP